jgi:hypothetical protein
MDIACKLSIASTNTIYFTVHGSAVMLKCCYTVHGFAYKGETFATVPQKFTVIVNVKLGVDTAVKFGSVDLKHTENSSVYLAYCLDCRG